MQPVRLPAVTAPPPRHNLTSFCFLRTIKYHVCSIAQGFGGKWENRTLGLRREQGSGPHEPLRTVLSGGGGGGAEGGRTTLCLVNVYGLVACCVDDAHTPPPSFFFFF